MAVADCRVICFWQLYIWFESYLKGRTQHVAILRKFGVQFHCYADDTQLYIPFSQNDNSCLGSIEECVSEIQIWMKANFLKLNAEKTEMIILSSPYFAKARTHDMIINLNGDLIHPNRAVRNLGVIFDNTMNMESHVNKICQTAYIHLRNISKIRPYITKDACESLVHAFITSRLDSVNAVLYGLPKFLIKKLQRVQNFSARLITGSYKYDHITPVLKSLHWLPVEQRIRYCSFRFQMCKWVSTRLSAKPCWIVHSQTNS